MKVQNLILALLFAAPLRVAACDWQNVARQVHATAHAWFSPGPNAHVFLAGTLLPSEQRTFNISGEDFLVENDSLFKQDIFVISGKSLASDATVWMARSNPFTCKVLESTELLHTKLGSLKALVRNAK